MESGDLTHHFHNRMDIRIYEANLKTDCTKAWTQVER